MASVHWINSSSGHLYANRFLNHLPHRCSSKVCNIWQHFTKMNNHNNSQPSLSVDLSPLQNLISIFVQFLFLRYIDKQTNTDPFILKLAVYGIKLKFACVVLKGGGYCWRYSRVRAEISFFVSHYGVVSWTASFLQIIVDVGANKSYLSSSLGLRVWCQYNVFTLLQFSGT